VVVKGPAHVFFPPRLMSAEAFHPIASFERVLFFFCSNAFYGGLMRIACGFYGLSSCSRFLSDVGISDPPFRVEHEASPPEVDSFFLLRVCLLILLEFGRVFVLKGTAIRCGFAGPRFSLTSLAAESPLMAGGREGLMAFPFFILFA